MLHTYFRLFIIPFFCAITFFETTVAMDYNQQLEQTYLQLSHQIDGLEKNYETIRSMRDELESKRELAERGTRSDDSMVRAIQDITNQPDFQNSSESVNSLNKLISFAETEQLKLKETEKELNEKENELRLLRLKIDELKEQQKSILEKLTHEKIAQEQKQIEEKDRLAELTRANEAKKPAEVQRRRREAVQSLSRGYNKPKLVVHGGMFSSQPPRR